MTDNKSIGQMFVEWYKNNEENERLNRVFTTTSIYIPCETRYAMMIGSAICKYKTKNWKLRHYKKMAKKQLLKG